MNVKNILISAMAILAICSVNILQADETETGNKDHVWMIKKPSNKYWQSPDDSDINQPRQDPQTADSQPTDENGEIETGSAGGPLERTNQPELSGSKYNAAGKISGRAVQTFPVRDIAQTKLVPPAPPGPYLSSSFPPDSGASAYYLPGYHRYMEYDTRLNQHSGYPVRTLPYGESAPNQSVPYPQYPSAPNDDMNFSDRRDTTQRRHYVAPARPAP